MSDSSKSPLRSWLAAPLDSDVSEALERLRRAPDVQQIAVMPDVHLAAEVCIGVVVATSHLIYPQAVGGDIGCGMLAVAVNAEATETEESEGCSSVAEGTWASNTGAKTQPRRCSRAVSEIGKRAAESCQPGDDAPKGRRDRVCDSWQRKPFP